MQNRRYANRMNLVKPSAIRELLKLGADPEVIAFGGGFPDPELFPVAKLKHALDVVMEKHGRQALQYSTTEGLPVLREKLVKRMNRAGVACTFDELIIIQGAQQSMDLIGKMFIDKGDTIVVERPTFLGALVAFNPFEPNYLDIPVDDDGMRMDELERALAANPGVKLIYTIPEFQNPSGKTMSLERRKRLMELAEQYDVMILEDSPYREIRYEGEELPLLKSLDKSGRVIHVGSFSKILCPGMRLGWIVGDKEILTKLCQLKMAADTQNSTLNMYAVNAFMDLYDLDENIATLRAAYKYKKSVMLGVIEDKFPKSVSYSNPQGGLFTWLTLPEGAEAAAIMRDRLLPEAKVAYVPGDSFFARDQRSNYCRLNYSCMSEEKIVSGMTKMGKIFTECLG